MKGRRGPQQGHEPQNWRLGLNQGEQETREEEEEDIALGPGKGNHRGKGIQLPQKSLAAPT